MPIKELPGFYFDHEKNRYFPIKSAVPGRAPKRPKQECEPRAPEPIQRIKRADATKLLHIRELHGNIFTLNKERQSFKQTCCNAHASNPMVWKYADMSGLADSAVCQFRALFQTSEGQTESSVLSLGSRSGGICIREFGDVGQHFEHGFNTLPKPVWPPNCKYDEYCLPVSLWGSAEVSTSFPCGVSSINRIGTPSHDHFGDQTLQNGLISTLGCGGSGGSLYIMNLTEAMDFNRNMFNIKRRFQKVASLECTLWTAVCSPHRGQAAVGTDRGAALINLESGSISWLLRCKSDIFSEQFDNSGNILLCGHRNGSIRSIDIRQRNQNSFGLSGQPSTSTLQPAMKKIGGGSGVRNRIKMDLSVCSLALLASDDRYLLGSSMDGSIKLFDRCLLGRGPVQSYEGHVNSHSHIQLGVNPSETQFISGGGDGYARIWNIKTADLLFAKKISDFIPSSACWAQDALQWSTKSRSLGGNNLHMADHSWHAWLGSRDGLFYIHG